MRCPAILASSWVYYMPTQAVHETVSRGEMLFMLGLIALRLHLYAVVSISAIHRSALCSSIIILMVSYELAAHAHGMQASSRASISLALRQRIVQEALAKPCRIPTDWVEVEDVSLHVEKQVWGVIR